MSDWLRQRHLGISEPEFVAGLDRMVTRASEPGVAPLSAQDEAFLDAYAAARPASPQDVERSRARSAQRATALLGTSVSVREVAERLGVAASTIRHRIRDRALYALPSTGERGSRRLPRWQFDEDLHPLPGLREVLAALPVDMHPLQVVAFFATAQPELTVEDQDLSPREWLSQGGDPGLVATLAAGLDDTTTGPGTAAPGRPAEPSSDCADNLREEG